MSACLLLPLLPALAPGQCAPGVRVAPYYPPVVVVKKVPVVVEKVIVKEVPFAVPVPFALFQFTAPPTTPPPVLLAAPPPASTCPLTSSSNAPGMAGRVSPATAGAPLDVEARLARIEAALEKLAGTAARLPDDHRAAPQGEGPPVAITGGTVSVSDSGGPAPAPPVTADLAAVVGLARTRCAACHTGNRARGDIVLFNGRGEWSPTVPPSEVWDAVKPPRRKMPKGSPHPLSDAELALVRAWKESQK